MNWLIAAIIAVGVFIAYMAFVGRAAKKETLRDRVDRMTSGSFSPDEERGQGDDISLLSYDEEKTALSRFFEGFLMLLGTNLEAARKEYQAMLAQAGINSINGLIAYLFMKRIGLPILGGIGAVSMYVAYTSPVAPTLLKILYAMLGVICVIIALKGADLYIYNRTVKRKARLVRSFPDALDLLLVCVESGLALDGALSRVCKELGRAHPDITQELNRTRLELTLLNDRTKALQNLGERTGLVPFRSLVSTLIQSEKFGTSLADTLRVLSEDYRLTRLMLAEQKAGRLPVLMTVPLILLMLPAFVMIVVAPAIIKVIEVTRD